MYETYSSVEAIHYLLSKLGSLDRITLVKFIFLSDKCHLIRYGRTITEDNYVAMGEGPVGSKVLDILELDGRNLESEELEFIKKHFKKGSGFLLEEVEPFGKADYLSESDIAALDTVIKEHGQKSSKELWDISHKYPEWRQYEAKLKSKEIKSAPIHAEEMLSVLDHDPLGMPQEHIEESRRVITGHF